MEYRAPKGQVKQYPLGLHIGEREVARIEAYIKKVLPTLDAVWNVFPADRAGDQTAFAELDSTYGPTVQAFVDALLGITALMSDPVELRCEVLTYSGDGERKEYERWYGLGKDGKWRNLEAYDCGANRVDQGKVAAKLIKAGIQSQTTYKPVKEVR